MAVRLGPKITSKDIVFSVDARNRKSNFQLTESSNLLPDPNSWTTGSGGSTGYGATVVIVSKTDMKLLMIPGTAVVLFGKPFLIQQVVQTAAGIVLTIQQTRATHTAGVCGLEKLQISPTVLFISG